MDHAFKVHSAPGPGLLESACEEWLMDEFIQSGLLGERQKIRPLVYKDVRLDDGYRIDLVAEGKIIIDVKSIDTQADIHSAQILPHMKRSRTKPGLLVNFNVKQLKEGIKRVIP